jgi:hypothetical protein
MRGEPRHVANGDGLRVLVGHQRGAQRNLTHCHRAPASPYFRRPPPSGRRLATDGTFSREAQGPTELGLGACKPLGVIIHLRVLSAPLISAASFAPAALDSSLWRGDVINVACHTRIPDSARGSSPGAVQLDLRRLYSLRSRGSIGGIRLIHIVITIIVVLAALLLALRLGLKWLFPYYD